MERTTLTINTLADKIKKSKSAVQNRQMKKSSGNPNIIQKKVNSFCKLLGHNWMYKDYLNWMKENGDDYDFKASRNCSRCNQNEYLYTEWKSEDQKSPYDTESDAHSVKQLDSLQAQ